MYAYLSSFIYIYNVQSKSYVGSWNLYKFGIDNAKNPYHNNYDILIVVK